MAIYSIGLDAYDPVGNEHVSDHVCVEAESQEEAFELAYKYSDPKVRYDVDCSVYGVYDVETYKGEYYDKNGVKIVKQ